MEIKGHACGLTSPRPVRQNVYTKAKSPHRVVTPIDKDWAFRRLDSESSHFLPVAQFPTNIHLDLNHHKIIPDPFIGKNEIDVQWVGEKAWVYKTTFPSPIAQNEKVVLVFDGLDTYAAVVLNGKEILKTENMFIPERIDVTTLLRSNEDNVLELTFASTYLVGKKLVEEHPEHRWGCWNGDASRLAVRKAQYHYVGLDISMRQAHGLTRSFSRDGTGVQPYSLADPGDRSILKCTPPVSRTCILALRSTSLWIQLKW